jgi:hypothetical protein
MREATREQCPRAIRLAERGCDQNLVHPTQPLVEVAAQPPELHQSRSNGGNRVAVTRREAPSECGSKVVVLELEPLQRGALAGAVQRRRYGCQQAEVEARVRLPELGSLASRLELLRRERADRLEHREARLVGTG